MGEKFCVNSTSDTLQLSLGVDQPHNNRYLFSDHYLENLLPAETSSARPRSAKPRSACVNLLKSTDMSIR